MQKQVVALLAGMFIADMANAVAIADPLDLDLELALGVESRYRHSINDDDFLLGSATSATLLVEYSPASTSSAAYIQSCNTVCDAALLPGLATVIAGEVVPPVPRLSVDGADVNLSLEYLLNSTSLAALNADGFVEVDVWNNTLNPGSLTVDRSTLTVNGELNTPVMPPAPGTPPAAVSEPAVLSLLGLGLLAGTLRRRRAA